MAHFTRIPKSILRISYRYEYENLSLHDIYSLRFHKELREEILREYRDRKPSRLANYRAGMCAFRMNHGESPF